MIRINLIDNRSLIIKLIYLSKLVWLIPCCRSIELSSHKKINPDLSNRKNGNKSPSKETGPLIAIVKS